MLHSKMANDEEAEITVSPVNLDIYDERVQYVLAKYDCQSKESIIEE